MIVHKYRISLPYLPAFNQKSSLLSLSSLDENMQANRYFHHQIGEPLAGPSTPEVTREKSVWGEGHWKHGEAEMLQCWIKSEKISVFSESPAAGKTCSLNYRHVSLLFSWICKRERKKPNRNTLFHFGELISSNASLLFVKPFVKKKGN